MVILVIGFFAIASGQGILYLWPLSVILAIEGVAWGFTAGYPWVALLSIGVLMACTVILIPASPIPILTWLFVGALQEIGASSQNPWVIVAIFPLGIVILLLFMTQIMLLGDAF